MLRISSEHHSYWGNYVSRIGGSVVLAFLLLAIQLFPAVLYYISQARLPYVGELIYQGISLLTWTAIPCLALAFVPWRGIRRTLAGIIILIYALVMLFEAFLVYSYGTLYTDSIALNILATNPGEASAFLEHLNYRVFLLPLMVLVGLGCVLFVLRRRVSSDSLLVGRILTSIFVLCPLVSALLVLPAQRDTKSYFYMAPLERLYQGTTICLRDAQDLAEYTRRAKEIDLGELHQAEDLQDFDVVVIIGESMRRDYMHCYGYPLLDTPAQDSLIATGDLIPFTDVISSASWTTGSVSQAMSFYRRDGSEKEWYHYPTLPYLMSKAGYFSSWLSNQEKQGAGLQPIATLATTADSALFAKNRTTGDWDSAYDLELIPMLPKLGELPQGKRSLFQVIHLMGSHTPYSDRSVAGLAPFCIDDLPKRLPNGAPAPTDAKRQGILRDYVNSIYYNDEVIRQIVDHFSHQKTLLFYFSDHGQALFENPDRPDYYEHEVSIAGVSIPFFVYFSPALRVAHPELYAKVQKAKDRKIMNDLFSNSLSGLLGIRSAFYEPRYDFFSPEYDETRRRTVSGYDGAPVEF